MKVGMIVFEDDESAHGAIPGSQVDCSD